ncbi:MAG: hypothetical protein HFF40_02710 [Lawsonibacter sp.]|jgi:hypothetical protein|nr:hypothetical protein [Lawsonibacter sp.]
MNFKPGGSGLKSAGCAIVHCGVHILHFLHIAHPSEMCKIFRQSSSSTAGGARNRAAAQRQSPILAAPAGQAEIGTQYACNVFAVCHAEPFAGIEMEIQPE